ncbi:MAG: hypothetical protein ACLGGX_12130 [Bdellovibrionia bacterium]
MFKVFFGIVFALLNTANAIEFSSKEIKNADGANESILLRIDDFGTYSALFRKSYSNSILCETGKNSYWEHSKGDFLFWSLGKGGAISCMSGAKCLLLELGKNVPFFSEQVVELFEVPNGTLAQTPNSPLCQ